MYSNKKLLISVIQEMLTKQHSLNDVGCFLQEIGLALIINFITTFGLSKTLKKKVKQFVT